MESENFAFGPYIIYPKQVFYSTHSSFAMVNLRPLLPGHVLVIPRREVKRFTDLTAEEASDLWITAQKVGREIESYHEGSSLTLTIQDGPQAGQSVPHVHIHILPRKSGNVDEHVAIDLDIERKDRSMEEMVEEADRY